MFNCIFVYCILLLIICKITFSHLYTSISAKTKKKKESNPYRAPTIKIKISHNNGTCELYINWMAFFNVIYKPSFYECCAVQYMYNYILYI